MKEQHSILVVEDDLDIRTLIVELLEDAGYLCTSAGDGLEGKQALESQPFHLLITDFRMPKLDGLQLLEWCRVSELDTAVIFLSADAGLSSSEKLIIEQSSATILQKPLNIDTLLNTVKEILRML